MAKRRLQEVKEDLDGETEQVEALRKQAEETAANLVALEERFKELEALRDKEKEKLAEVEAKIEETKRDCINTKAAAAKLDEVKEPQNGEQYADEARKVHQRGAILVAVAGLIIGAVKFIF